MKSWIREKLSSFTKEDYAVFIFGASFFIGAWYALPMVNSVTDVWAFGGGVLRAMKEHTLLPGIDVAYGIISFYQNYVVMGVFLLIGYIFTGFDLGALETILTFNPSYGLIPARITSIITAIVLLIVVYRFLKEHISSSWWRFTLLVLVFGNVLSASLIRTGKMWVLSITLGVISFIYLYNALVKERENGVPGRSSMISVITAFLATANFPFAAVFLINIPIIFISFSKTAESLRKFVKIVFSGAAIFIAVIALNFRNTFDLVSSFVVDFFTTSGELIIDNKPALSFFEAFMVNARQAVESFPLLLIALLFVAVPIIGTKVKDKTLAYLSLIYGVVYIVAASAIFRSDHGLSLNIRHIFPLCFFLLFLIVAYRPTRRIIALPFLTIGIVIYIYTVILLSVPTSYNDTFDYISLNYGDKDVRIDENIFELTLPMKKDSYELLADDNCGSTCKNRRLLEEDISFRPLVVTDQADSAKIANLPPADFVLLEKRIAGCAPIVKFGNNIPDDEIFDIDINLGRMIFPSFYKIDQLGKNIYLYDTSECPTVGFENGRQ